MQITADKLIRNSISKIAEYEIWIVVFAVGISIAHPNILPVTLGVIVLFWFIRWIVYGRLSIRTPVDFSIVILIVITLFNIWTSVSLENTIPQFLRLLTGIGLFYAVVNWALTINRVRLIILSFALLAIFLSIYGFFSVEWNPLKIPIIPEKIYEYIPTLISDVVHRNVMGGILIIIFPSILAILLFEYKNMLKVEVLVYFISILSSVTVLILTQTRAAWISFLFIFVILAFLKIGFSKKYLPILLFFSAIALVLVGIYLLPRFNTSNFSVQGIEGRIEIWSRAIEMVQDFPITGIGLGLFGLFADGLYPFVQYSPGNIPHAHNVYLQIAVDLGIPGLITWLSILFCMCFIVIRLFLFSNRKQLVWVKGISAGLLTSQVGLVIHGLFDSVIWGMIRPAPIVWALWGIILSSFLIAKKLKNGLSESDTQTTEISFNNN